MQGCLAARAIAYDPDRSREDDHNRPDSQSKLVNKIYCERENILMPNT